MCCWWPYLTIIQLYEEKPQEESEPSEEDQQDERTEEEILGREMLDIFGQEFELPPLNDLPPMSTSNVSKCFVLSICTRIMVSKGMVSKSKYSISEKN